MLLRAIDKFFSHGASGGLLLMLSAVFAMIVANTALAPYYDSTLSAKFALTINGEGLAKPLILWINDGLMAIFFFLIGLELKREMVEGKLKNPRDVLLPGAAAIGGMVVPAAIYAALKPFPGGQSRQPQILPLLWVFSRWSAAVPQLRLRSFC